MSDNDQLQLTAVVKAMVEPFRRVVGRPQPEEKEAGPRMIEMTFLKDHERPTDEQTQIIGRVATSWAVLERMLGMLLAKLAMVPDFPAMALTKDLGLDQQVKAAKSLIALHRSRYGLQVIESDWLDVHANMLIEFEKLRHERNLVTHTVWVRVGDRLISLKSRPVTERAAAEQAPVERSTDELNKLANDIQQLADAMFVVGQYMPEVDEMVHVQTLSSFPKPPSPTTKR